MPDKSFTPKELSEMLSYDPKTGLFKWAYRPEKLFRSPASAKSWNNKYAGKVVAVFDNGRGYHIIAVRRQKLKAHRVAWALTHGQYPCGSIDHIDGDGHNNKLSNLRDVSHAENMRNRRLSSKNKTGVPGVFWNGRNFEVAIKYLQKKYHLGNFQDLATATAVRKSAEMQFGFHANNGRQA